MAKVLYNDGEREDVNLRTFDILMRNDAWRSQVLLLQGFVPAVSVQSGRFSDQGAKTVSFFLIPPSLICVVS
jgi:hypothetical protein